MQYVVSLSGGTASAAAADRAITRYGREAVTLWFADTSWEDEDLHRFLADCMARWGGALTTYRDGRNPLQVAEDQNIIPNQRVAPCTTVLKIKPFVKWLATAPKPITVLLGLDWREQHRMARPKANYEATPGVAVDYPLMWQPYEFRPYSEVVRAWGIEPPRLYALGFPHNNCGGRCVKQGIAEWQRLSLTFPERFAHVRDWEQEQRAKGGARANYAILRDRAGGTTTPMTLAALEQLSAGQQTIASLTSDDDQFACFCSED